MNPWAAFILGLLIGWLVEWIIDWVYWRRKVKAAAEENVAYKSQMERLRAEGAIYPTRIEKLQADLASCSDRTSTLDAEKIKLQGELHEKDAEIAELKAKLGSAESMTRSGMIDVEPQVKDTKVTKVDDLEIIVGIGPVIAKILNNAGIFSFADLGKLSVEELRSIVGERVQRLADEEKLLAQARDLAAKQG